MKIFESISVLLAVTQQSPYPEARPGYQPPSQVKTDPGGSYHPPRPAAPTPQITPTATTTQTPAQVQPQVSAKQIEVIKKDEIKDQKLILRKTMFKNFLLTSIILIIIGIILAVALLPLTTSTPDEVEDATEDRTPEELKGKSWTMLGTIENKEETEVDGETIYSYDFEDTDLKFKSSEDIGDKGDEVVITVQNTELEPLEASNPENLIVYYLPGIILIVIGIIHLILAILIKRKMDNE
jgi:hypothetical protein